MKPFYRRKGKYKDGRTRIVITKKIGVDLKTKALPKPEKLWDLLDIWRTQDFVQKRLKKTTENLVVD